MHSQSFEVTHLSPSPYVMPRKTKRAGNQILHNSLRPAVTASDRLTRWLTPFGLHDMNSRAEFLPMHIITRERLLIAHAVAPKMWSNYGAGLLRFNRFCDDLHIPEEL